MRKLNGITIDGEFLGNSVVINGMFRAICTISPIVMRDFVYIINKVDLLEEAVRINTFNCPDTSSIDIEFSNSQTEGYATLFYTLQNSQPRLLDCNLVLGDEEVIGSLLDDEDFLDSYSPESTDEYSEYDEDEYYDNDGYYDSDDNGNYQEQSERSGKKSGSSSKRTENRTSDSDSEYMEDNNYEDTETPEEGGSTSGSNTSKQRIENKNADKSKTNNDTYTGTTDSETEPEAENTSPASADRKSLMERRKLGTDRGSGARSSAMQERLERMKKQRERREQLKERVKQRREEINDTISEMQETALDRLKNKKAKEEGEEEKLSQKPVKEVSSKPDRYDPEPSDNDFIKGHVSDAKEINDYTIIAKTLKIEAQNMEGFGFPTQGNMNQAGMYGNNGFGGQQGGFGNPQDQFGNSQGFNNSFGNGQDFNNFGDSDNSFGSFNDDFGSNPQSGFNQDFGSQQNSGFGNNNFQNGFNGQQMQNNGNMWQSPQYGPNNGMSYPNMNNPNGPMPPRELYTVNENYNADDISDLYSNFYDIPEDIEGTGAEQGANGGAAAQNPDVETSELDALKAELEALKAANTPPDGLMTLEEFRAQQKELEEERLKASRRKMKIVGSRERVNANALDGGVFVSGKKVYKWGDPRQLNE